MNSDVLLVVRQAMVRQDYGTLDSRRGFLYLAAA